jgi:hypothetical protein
MRDLWRRTRSQFVRSERDLVIHVPQEAPRFVNEVRSNLAAEWASMTTFDLNLSSSVATFTDGTLEGVAATYSILSPASYPLYARWATPIPWRGEDVWVAAIVKAQSAAAAVSFIAVSAEFVNISGSTVTSVGTWTATGAGRVATPGTSNYYLVLARMPAAQNSMAGATHVMPQIITSVPVASGGYVVRIARASAALLHVDEPTPAGYVSAELPGFEWEGIAALSRSYGPCYAVNQVSNPDVTAASSWVNDSTSGATVDVAGGIVSSWPDSERGSTLWSIHNPNTTSRTLAVRTPATLSDPGLFVVAGGRQYRAHVRIRVDEAYSAGALQIVWLDKSGAGDLHVYGRGVRRCGDGRRRS